MTPTSPVPGIGLPPPHAAETPRWSPAPVTAWADGPCPDCGAPTGHLCYWFCPRHADTLYDLEAPDGE